ncbi:MAG: catalase [Ignavibacteria bacterium]
MSKGLNWKEEYFNEDGKYEKGTIEKEEIFFDRIALQIREVVKHYKEANNNIPARAIHAKTLAGFTDAVFRVLPGLPQDLNAGFLIPGKEYRATVRFSNASGEIIDDDSKPDLRGIAVRIDAGKDGHDLLMTNAELHHAKDAREAMFAIRAGVEKDIMEDKIPDQFPLESEIAEMIGALPFLLKNLGFKTTIHIAGTLRKQMKIKVKSLSTETFWSRASVAIGNSITPEKSVAVKFRLRPQKIKPEQDEIKEGEKNLRQKIESELREDDIKFYFEVQRFKDEESTPVEDARISWGDDTSFKTIAELIIPKNSKNESELVGCTCIQSVEC